MPQIVVGGASTPTNRASALSRPNPRVTNEPASVSSGSDDESNTFPFGSTNCTHMPSQRRNQFATPSIVTSMRPSPSRDMALGG